MGRPDESQDGLAETPEDGAGTTTGPEPGRPASWLQRLLDNKTGVQRAVISLGALAAAVLAIWGVVAAVVRIVDDDGGGRSLEATAPAETQGIESGTVAANEFVRDLLDHNGGVVGLNHRVIAEKGPADVRLRYECSDAGVCAMVRLQDVVVAAATMPDGLWFKGCFAVTQDGNGYGAEPLDIELKHQGDACL